MIAGFSTDSRPTCSHSKETARVVWFEGNYANYEADRRRRLGAGAEQPHRARFRRLDA